MCGGEEVGGGGGGIKAEHLWKRAASGWVRRDGEERVVVGWRELTEGRQRACDSATHASH